MGCGERGSRKRDFALLSRTEKIGDLNCFKSPIFFILGTLEKDFSLKKGPGLASPLAPLAPLLIRRKVCYLASEI